MQAERRQIRLINLFADNLLVVFANGINPSFAPLLFGVGQLLQLILRHNQYGVVVRMPAGVGRVLVTVIDSNFEPTHPTLQVNSSSTLTTSIIGDQVLPSLTQHIKQAIQIIPAVDGSDFSSFYSADSQQRLAINGGANRMHIN